MASLATALTAASDSSKDHAAAAMDARLESFREGLADDKRSAFAEIVAGYKAGARTLAEGNKFKEAEVEFLKGEMTGQHEQILTLLEEAQEVREEASASSLDLARFVFSEARRGRDCTTDDGRIVFHSRNTKIIGDEV